MRNTTTIYFYLVLFLLGCSKSSDTPSGPLAGKTVVFMGDVGGYDAKSIQNRWTTMFCSFMKCMEVNLPGGNNGHALFQDGFSKFAHNDSLHCSEWIPYSFDQTTIPTKLSTYGALFLAFGVSDVAIYGGLLTATDFQNRLSSVVDYAVNSRGWSYSQIVIVTPYYFVNWNFACSHQIFDGSRLLDHVNAAVAVATAKGCVSANIYDAMVKSTNPLSLLDGPDQGNINGGPTYSGEGMALNDNGHRFVANFLAGLKYN